VRAISGHRGLPFADRIAEIGRRPGFLDQAVEIGKT